MDAIAASPAAPPSLDKDAAVGQPASVDIKSRDLRALAASRTSLDAELDVAWREFLDVKQHLSETKIQSVYGANGMTSHSAIEAWIADLEQPGAPEDDVLFAQMLKGELDAGAHAIALVHRTRLTRTPDGYAVERKTVQQVTQLCSEDALVSTSELSLSQCSGVIVGTDRILTAKHCLLGEFRGDADQIRVVLDYKKGVEKLPGTDVFTVEARPPGQRDWVVLKLKDGRHFPPKRVASWSKRRPGESTDIFAVSYPLGTPRTTSRNASIIRYEGGNFVTDLDVLRGSSGCPVFSARDGFLVGILTAGPEDFETVHRPDGTTCKRVIRRPSPANGGPGEQVLPLHDILSELDR